MEIQFYISLCLVFSAFFTGFLIIYGVKNVQTTGAKPYVALMLSIIVYCLGYALEINQTTAAGMFMALRFEYIGIAFLPACWLYLALGYARQENLPRWLYLVVFSVPVMTVVMVNTNQWHHLHYSSFGVDASGPFPMSSFSKGIWYYINLFYANICFIAGNLLFLRMMLRSAGRSRKQAATMFFASIIPWIGLFVYQTGLAPYRIDIVPFTFALTGPLFGLALMRFRMFDFVPIARHVVFDIMRDPVLVVDAFGRLADYNRAASAVFPELSSRGIGNSLNVILSGQQELLEGLKPPYNVPAEILIGKVTSPQIYEVSLFPISSKQHETAGNVLMLHDITRQKHLLDTFQKQARRDELTGIYNRRHFMALGRKKIRQMLRYGRAFSIGIVDLDFFKGINDQYGHLAGDEVLQRAAALFADVLRDGDILGRYGGEEFVFFLPETEPEAAVLVAERLRLAIAEQEIALEGEIIHITASFGITGRLPDEAEINLRDLIKKADDALYRAKEGGRNRVELLL